jgi:hypothetical protein
VLAFLLGGVRAHRWRFSNLFFIEVKGRVAGADSVTLTINEVNRGRNAPH